MKSFLKVGDKVLKKADKSFDYELVPGVTYTAKVDRFEDEVFLTIGADLSIPTKIYSTKKDDRFKDRVISRFNKSEKGFTGVMLTGVKGSGKTMTCKCIATEAKLPIIKIGDDFYRGYLNKLFEMLGDTSTCILFDEIDKYTNILNGNELLSLLDGINTVGKHLIIFTANETNCLNENLMNRCSRIRYWKKFNELDKETITLIIKDYINDATKVDDVVNFIIDNFECKSFDNIVSFSEEINEYPNDDLMELFNDMNLYKIK